MALVSARATGDLDVDMEPLVEALAAGSVDASVQCWDDSAVNWGDYDLAVIRSTWDYAARRDEFLRWAERAGAATRLEHTAAVLRWNTDKRYLADLQGAGVAVVPSRFFGPDEAVDLPEAGEFVVKPSISAGSRDTCRFTAHEHHEARQLAQVIAATGRTVMVQPYVASVDRRGETALLFFNGEYSHAINKGPMLVPGAAPTQDLYLSEVIAACTPGPEELAAGRGVLEALATLDSIGGDVSPPLYARIDLLAGSDDSPLLLELEMCEPSLFLEFDEHAADRVAAAIVSRLC